MRNRGVAHGEGFRGLEHGVIVRWPVVEHSWGYREEGGREVGHRGGAWWDREMVHGGVTVR